MSSPVTLVFDAPTNRCDACDARGVPVVLLRVEKVRSFCAFCQDCVVNMRAQLEQAGLWRS